MRFKLLTILVSFAVMLSMLSGAACAGGFSGKGKPACQKSRTHDVDITQNAASPCHLKPCQTSKSRVFLLPEVHARRQATEKRISDTLSAAPLLTPALTAGRHFSAAARDVLQLSPSFSPPPLFSLLCVYIC
jgi:hypothetical protein